MNAINNITISKKLIAAFLTLVVIIGALAGAIGSGIAASRFLDI